MAKNLSNSREGLVSPDMPIFLPRLFGPTTSTDLIMMPLNIMSSPYCNLWNKPPLGIPNSMALATLNLPGRSNSSRENEYEGTECSDRQQDI